MNFIFRSQTIAEFTHGWHGLLVARVSWFLLVDEGVHQPRVRSRIVSGGRPRPPDLASGDHPPHRLSIGGQGLPPSYSLLRQYYINVASNESFDAALVLLL